MFVYNNLVQDGEESYYEPISMLVFTDADGNGIPDYDEQIRLNSSKHPNKAFESYGTIDERVFAMIDDTGDENVNITLILADETYEGSYNINIVKKELKDNQEDNYQNENAKFISTLSDAKYSVQQSLNND